MSVSTGGRCFTFSAARHDALRIDFCLKLENVFFLFIKMCDDYLILYIYLFSFFAMFVVPLLECLHTHTKIQMQKYLIL